MLTRCVAFFLLQGEEQVEISLGRIKAPFCETASFVGYESSFVDRHESDGK